MYLLLDVCRLCLSYKNEFYDLCSDDIMEKLVTCISDLEFENHIPSVICEKCIEQVDLYYEFRNKCLRSEFIINNYVDKLLSGDQSSHLKSKLQVKVSKDFSPTKFPCNVKLPHTFLASSSTNTNMNKRNLEDSEFEGVHTDITERVKLRKRSPAKRRLSITTEKSASINRSDNQKLIEHIPIKKVHQSKNDVAIHAAERVQVITVPENLPLTLNQSPIMCEEMDSSVISSIIGVPCKQSSLDTSYLRCTQTSMQIENCHLQAPATNSNHNSTEPSFVSVNLERKLTYQPDNASQTYCKDVPLTSNQNVAPQKIYSEEVATNSNQNVLFNENLKRKLTCQPDNSSQTYCKDVPLTSNQNVTPQEIYSEEVATNSNHNVLSNENNVNSDDKIDVDDEEPLIYEIEDDDTPDEINRMMLLESLLSKEHSKARLPKSSVQVPIQPKRKSFSMKEYVHLNISDHISSSEHNYSGQIYVPTSNKLTTTTTPTIDCSSSSDNETVVDVEGISEDEEPRYIDGHVIKSLQERNRRKKLRNYFEDLLFALPPTNRYAKRSKLSILNESKDYIKSLEGKVLKNIDEVNTLKAKNLLLKERLNEIMKINNKR